MGNLNELSINDLCMMHDQDGTEFVVEDGVIAYVLQNR